MPEIILRVAVSLFDIFHTDEFRNMDTDAISIVVPAKMKITFSIDIAGYNPVLTNSPVI